MSTSTDFCLPDHGCRHGARFHHDEDSLIREIAEFADQALRRGGSAIIIATGAHLSRVALVLHGFGGGADERPWYPGRLVLLDAAATLERVLVDGWPDGDRMDAVLGPLLQPPPGSPGPVHAYGEMVGLLCERGRFDAALHMEALWNGLGERHPFRLLCGYPDRLFDDNDHGHYFRHVCATHDCVLRDDPPDDGALPDAARQGAWQRRTVALRHEVERLRRAETTLRAREQDLIDFLNNAAEGIHRVGADGTILWANAAELALLGYAADEYVGRHIAEFHVDGDVIADMLVRLAAGETLYDQPARLRCKDGSIRHVLIHSNGCFRDGKLLYTRCFTRDVTEAVRTRERLEAAHAERERLVRDLSEASRAKDEFLAMLGHELRNPLSPIVTALQLIRMRGITGAEREHLIIERQVNHLVRLVDDLLDVSRITRGTIELKHEWVRIADVLAKALEMASPLLEQRRHRLTTDIDPALMWYGDPVRLAQAVGNLLTNAARYTDMGGHLALRASPLGDDALVITVSDDGMGIPADVLPRIFDPFFQGPRRIDRAGGGLGIGLALVRNLVELHGGTVAASSDGPGKGSVFAVQLPVSRRGSEMPVADTGPPSEGPAETVARRILLVDDNVDAVQALAELLRACGHRVEAVYDPVSALRIAAAFAPEVALLDIGLPVMDGYELARRLRVALGGRPCLLIAVTGYGQSADRERSAAAGFDRHLVKPVALDALLEHVRALH